MKKRQKTSKDNSRKTVQDEKRISPSLRKAENRFFPALGFLIGLTVFLSGEQNELTGSVHLPCVFWLLLLVCRAIGVLMPAKPVARFRFSRFDGFVYAFFGLAICSILWNLLPGQGGSVRESLNMLSVWMLLAAVWFLCRQILRAPGTATAVLGILVALTVSESFVSLYQQFVEIPEMKRLFETDPEGIVAQADPTLQPGSGDWNRLAIRLQTALPTGTFALSNTLGGFLACGLILLLGTFHGMEKRTKTIGKIGLVLLVFACLALTRCRSGFVAIGVGVLLLGVLPFRHRFGLSRKSLAAVLIGMTILAGLVGLTGSGKTFFSGAKRSLGFRLEYWEASLGMIRDYPLFGCGSGNFKHTYTKYKLPVSSEEIADPHNFAVEIAATAGLPALLVFCGVFGVLMIRSSGFFPSINSFSSADRNFGFDDTASHVIGPNRLFWGALLGCWAAFFLSFATGIGSGISFPLAASVAFPLVAWIFSLSQSKNGESLQISSPVIVVAIFVLLVHFSAAGGISVSSSALVLWVLAAIVANRYEIPKTEDEMEFSPESNRFSPIPFYLIALLGTVSLGAVYHFNLKPVQRALFLNMQWESEPKTQWMRRIELLRQSVLADPWSSRIRNNLASELFPVWLTATEGQFGSSSELDWRNEMLNTQQIMLRRAPRSSALHFLAAERVYAMFRQTGEIGFREQSLLLYREAIDRYPNNASFRARYAVILWEADLRKDAVEQGKRAIFLDDTMPHQDQKLSTEQRNAVLSLIEEFDHIPENP